MIQGTSIICPGAVTSFCPEMLELKAPKELLTFIIGPYETLVPLCPEQVIILSSLWSPRLVEKHLYVKKLGNNGWRQCHPIFEKCFKVTVGFRKFQCRSWNLKT